MFNYSEIVDLSLPITTGMEIPPGLKASAPKVEFELFRNHAENSIQLGIYRTIIHAGTHLDTPLHVIKDGPSLDQVPLDRWMGKAFCISLPEVKANQSITAEDLASNCPTLEPGMILLIHTGWSDKMFGKSEYWTDSPFLSPEAAQWIVDQKVKLAGYDFFQDEGPKALKLDPKSFKVHHIMLGNDCYNCEHLTNLARIAGKHVFFIGLPLRIAGGEGSPTRAIALL